MAKTRLGKASLFPTTRATAPARAEKPRSAPDDTALQEHLAAITPPNAPAGVVPTVVGRPRKHAEPLKKVTVLLRGSDKLFLDGLSLDIAKRTGTDASISRSEIIRAMLEAVEKSGVDLTGVSSEEELKNVLLDRLRR